MNLCNMRINDSPTVRQGFHKLNANFSCYCVMKTNSIILSSSIFCLPRSSMYYCGFYNKTIFVFISGCIYRAATASGIRTCILMKNEGSSNYAKLVIILIIVPTLTNHVGSMTWKKNVRGACKHLRNVCV